MPTNMERTIIITFSDPEKVLFTPWPIMYRLGGLDWIKQEENLFS